VTEEFACTVKAETARALLLDFGTIETWVPKSLLQDGTEVAERGDQGTVVLPRWFVEKEGIE